MLMKDTTVHSVQWSMPINFQGGDNWFYLLFPLHKVKGQYVHIHIKRKGVAWHMTSKDEFNQLWSFI